MSCFESHLSQLAVIGAAGKMGRGISLILLKLILKENLSGKHSLVLIDTQSGGFASLKDYLVVQINKCITKEDRWTFYYGKSFDERHANIIRYIDDILVFSDKFQELKSRKIIFEAVPELPELKIKVLKQASEEASQLAYIFSNTSSIPISYLEEKTDLQGRLIGFHFYNPPPVQPLIELIYSHYTSDDLKTLAMDTLKYMKKVSVQARDIAGFIGNGHFIREGLRAFSKIDIKQSSKERCRKIMTLNYVSEKGLLRPMGIFQLIDYVGLDVFYCIAKVLKDHLSNDCFESSLLDKFIEMNRQGGQTVEGNQKDGVFVYNERMIVGVYDPYTQDILKWNEAEHNAMFKYLGIDRDPCCQWKDLHPEKSISEMHDHFSHYLQGKSLFSTMTQTLMNESHRIAMKLLKDRVAESEDDINCVLVKGFHHRYGPINSFLLNKIEK